LSFACPEIKRPLTYTLEGASDGASGGKSTSGGKGEEKGVSDEKGDDFKEKK